MRRGLPIGPMVSTVAAVAAANILLAYVLTRALTRGQMLELGGETLGALAVVAIVGTAAAVVGWRRYLVRRGWRPGRSV